MEVHGVFEVRVCEFRKVTVTNVYFNFLTPDMHEFENQSLILKKMASK
jgi:hypothetical protein